MWHVFVYIWLKCLFQIFSIVSNLILNNLRQFQEFFTTRFVLKRSFLSAINMLLKRWQMLCLYSQELFIAIPVAGTCNATLHLKSLLKVNHVHYYNDNLKNVEWLECLYTWIKYPFAANYIYINGCILPNRRIY